MATNFRQLLMLLDGEGVQTKLNGRFTRHWLLPEGVGVKKRKHILKKILRFSGNESLVNSKFFAIRKNRTCPHENCVNPDCYSFIKVKGNSLTGMSFEDIQDLIDVIDIEEYNQVGPVEYLRNFNSNQPEFLKIDMKTLDVVVAHINKRKG